MFKASNEKVALKALTDLNEAVKKMPYYTRHGCGRNREH
jgi:hypothetical protein